MPQLHGVSTATVQPGRARMQVNENPRGQPPRGMRCRPSGWTFSQGVFTIAAMLLASSSTSPTWPGATNPGAVLDALAQRLRQFGSTPWRVAREVMLGVRGRLQRSFTIKSSRCDRGEKDWRPTRLVEDREMPCLSSPRASRSHRYLVSPSG